MKTSILPAAHTACEPMYAGGEPTTLLPSLREATNMTRWADDS